MNADPIGSDDPLGLSSTLTWGEILAGGGRGAIAGSSRGAGGLGLGALIGGAVGAAYGICKAAAESDPCAHCYEDDKRNIAQCKALAATAGRPGTKAYWRAYYACEQQMNQVLYKCLADCEAEGK